MLTKLSASRAYQTTTMSAADMASTQELQNLSGTQNQQVQSEDEQLEATPNVAEQSSPPCDRGGPAWRLLFTAFVFECLLWGRVFQS